MRNHSVIYIYSYILYIFNHIHVFVCLFVDSTYFNIIPLCSELYPFAETNMNTTARSTALPLEFLVKVSYPKGCHVFIHSTYQTVASMRMTSEIIRSGPGHRPCPSLCLPPARAECPKEGSNSGVERESNTSKMSDLRCFELQYFCAPNTHIHVYFCRTKQFEVNFSSTFFGVISQVDMSSCDISSTLYLKTVGRKWGYPWVPSGKRLHNYGKIHHFQ